MADNDLFAVIVGALGLILWLLIAAVSITLSLTMTFLVVYLLYHVIAILAGWPVDPLGIGGML